MNKELSNSGYAALRGLIAAPFTPMDDRGDLRLSVVSDYYRFLKHNGVRGAFICGSTGEGPSLSASEKTALMTVWQSAAGTDAEFKIIALVGGTDIRDCQRLAQEAARIGLYGIAFTAPFYFKPATPALLADCCEAVAGAAPQLPFYYYHIPVLTGVDFPMTALLEAVADRVPNFAGIKYTHEDFMDFLSCMHYSEGRFDMLWGRDETMLSALVLGVKAAVGSTYNYAAPLYLRLMAAFEKGDLAQANALQQKAIAMIRLLGKYGGIGVGKSYMKLAGIDCGAFRLPVRNMTPPAFAAFQKEAAALGFEDFKGLLPI